MKQNDQRAVVWALGLLGRGLTHGNMGFLAALDYGATSTGLQLLLQPCLVRKSFQNSPSHRIFNRMYGALNIDKNKN